MTPDDFDGPDWALLCSGPGHRPGGGTDVPAALAALAAAADHRAARQAGGRLYDLLHHADGSHGYLLPAAPAVPHLVRLTGEGPVAARESALALLVALAGGGPAVAEDCPGATGLDRRVDTALRQGEDAFHHLLTDPEPAVRATAFVLLTVLEHSPLLPLSGDARIAAQLDPRLTSDRYRRAVEHLHVHDWDRRVRILLGLAKVDPLFGAGVEYHGVEFGLEHGF
ncbi:hypothetical protein ACIQBJ_18555 [Kitasatospora sp. NPDC088391]|uniref:hypothetical protein n=1 Tax=Kitasatospora sp. NPDC088391 TaxID=3364074 RepID=UPI003823B3B5